jgi:hypothetical protein
MAAAAILDLDPTHERAGRVLEDIVRLEQMIFPEHASPGTPCTPATPPSAPPS